MEKAQYDEFRNLLTQMRDAQDSEVKTLLKGASLETVSLIEKLSGETQVMFKKMTDRLDELELAGKRPVRGAALAGLSPAEQKAYRHPSVRAYAKVAQEQPETLETFYKVCRIGYGHPNVTAAERKMLRSIEPDAQTKTMLLSDDTTGGFFAPADFIEIIIKNIVLISPIRGEATVKPTSRESAQVGKRTGTPSATWGNEQSILQNTAIHYGREDVTTHKLTALALISLQDLEDNVFDLEEQMSMDLAEEFARAEGAAFVLGDGTTRPEGLLTNPDIAVDNSGDANLLTGDGLVKQYHNLKSGYAPNAKWYLNRQTLGQVRLLKDNVGRYLLQPGIAAGNPNTILDSPYVETPDLPAVSAGTYPILFGDMKKTYVIVDRIGMSMQRLDQLFASQDAIGFKSRLRVGGQVVLAEAMRKMLIHS